MRREGESRPTTGEAVSIDVTDLLRDGCQLQEWVENQLSK